jgi:RND superfamily putative drug exporter
MTTEPSSKPSVFVRLAQWCMSHRLLTFGAWVVALVAAFSIGGAVGTRDIASFRLPDTESQAAYDLLAAHAPQANGGTDQLVYVAPAGKTLRADAAKSKMEGSIQAVRGDKIVAGVSDPLADGGQITPDGRIGVATITYKDEFQAFKPPDFESVQKKAFSTRGPDLRIEHGGFGAEIVRFAEQGGGTEFISVIAAALILLFFFGSAIAAGVPLLTAMLALGTTLGLVPVISHLVDTPEFAGQLAALIGLAVGIDYALIVVTRYRAEVGRGVERDAALLMAMDTAGRTVFFAGCTVIIALLGLLLLGLSFLHGAAIASALAVLLTMLGALTVLPAVLSKSGDWIDRLRLPLPGRERRSAAAAAAESPRWARWSELIQARPWPAVAVAVLVLLALATPALHMRLGTSDAGLDPEGTTTKNAYDLIAQGFGPGVNGSFLLATDLPRKGDAAAAATVAEAVKRDPNVAIVVPPQLSPDGEIATIVVFPKTGPQEEATTTLLERLRDDILPPVEQSTKTAVYVGGQVASQEDFADVIAGKLALFVGAIVLLSALLLMIMFRSIFIPIKAAILNLLSIGAALGFVTLVFEDGFLSSLLSSGTGPVESFVPVMVFAIVFGLSMDYEVFLVSRMHEEWLRTGDATRAVRNGLATTGRVVTAAATIMIVVFLTFALGPDRVIKEFGIGLAAAVFLDAFVIRILLVPALMQIAGERAWWLPAWLERRLPKVALEHEGPVPGIAGSAAAEAAPILP